MIEALRKDNVMLLLIVAALAACVWCLAPLPLAVAIGRAFRDGNAYDERAHAQLATIGATVPDGPADLLR